jgi:hypothetical protein
MDNKIKLISFCLIIAVISSCTKTNQKTLNAFKYVKPEIIEKNIQDYAMSTGKGIKINISNPADQEFLNLSTIIDSISYITLSNDPKATIGEINKIEFMSDGIYILDRFKTKSLKKFNLTGGFICQIGSYGEGPHEYVQPTDYTITDNEVIIYDQFKQRMIFYDHMGNYKRDIKVPFLFLKFLRLSSNKYIFYSLDQDNDHLQSIVNNSIFESDSIFSLKHRGFFRIKNMYESLFIENNFSNVGNKIFYNPTFSDTIFSIADNGIIKNEYIFDFGKRKLPKNFTLSKNIKELRLACDENYYIIFPGNNYVVLDDFLYFTFLIRHNVYHGIYSKSTGKTIIGNSILNDVAPIFNIQNVLTGQKNTLIGYLQPADIVNGFKATDRKLWVKKMGEKYTRIAEQMSEEDNPILLFYHLKK